MLSRRGMKFPLNVTLLLLGLAGVACAADWRLSDSWGFSLNGFSRDYETGKDDSNLFFRLNPSLNLSGEMHGRVKGQVDYGLEASLTGGDGTASSSSIFHDLDADLTAEVVKDRFYLGAGATAGMALRSDTDNTDSNTGLLDGVQTYSFRLTPEFFYPLGRNANFVSNNAIRYSGSSSDDSSNNISSRLNLGIRSGTRFSRSSWSMDYTREDRFLDERTDTVQSYDANASYRLNRRWSVSSGIGYSDSNAPTRRDSNSAVNWNLGTAWTPNSRTKANARYGQNYSGNVWDVDFSHVTKRTRIQADYSRSLTNVDNVLEQRLEPGINPDGTPVLDPITGLPIVEPIIVYVPTDENFIRTSVGGSVTLTGRRTNVVGSVRYSEREYDESGDSDESTLFRLSADRRLAERLSVNASTGVRDFSSSSGDENSSYFFQLGINRSFGRRSSIGATLSHRVYEPDDDTGYTDQRFSLTFRTGFL